MAEQMKFELHPKPEEKLPEYHFEREDECNRCGNPFEGDGSCPQCMSNPEKLAYLEKKKEQKKKNSANERNRKS